MPRLWPWSRDERPVGAEVDELDAEAMDVLWASSRRVTAAIVSALFPVVFILDQLLAVSLSPVLPGLALLVLLIAILPFPVMELALRRLDGLDRETRRKRAQRLLRRSRTGLNVALSWAAVWLILGL